ncbi:RICIN domain-containing protein [Streptomyces sp. TRM72054]|uniref:RICIN domain-containing protein n=1 Tax=Streptomyces sp. TRM72054 TaxID=2870562 RepID=UPI001C8B90C5|nr:RICIN domain-containing protein [Streptomyces sp. TRM72054]MBX9399549.1 RICIN domain-containing protein [Streptomyces sp. TRM72054]
MDVQFSSKESKEGGWVKGVSHGGIPPLPAKSTSIDEYSSAQYSVAQLGWRSDAPIASYYNFENYFNIQAAPTGAVGDADTALATFEDFIKFQRTAEPHSAGVLKTKGGGRLKLDLKAMPPSGEFVAKYRLTITDGDYSRPDKDPDLGSPVTHADPGPGSDYDISAGNNLKIDVPNSSKDWPKRLQLYPHNGTMAQQWKVVDTKAGGGYYQIRNAGNGLCLEISGSNPPSGAPVEQYKCDPNWANQPNQLWKFESAGSHQYKVVSKTGLTLNVDGNIGKNAQLVANQGEKYWKFEAPVNKDEVAGQFRESISSLKPNTDYKMQQCWVDLGSGNGPEPGKVTVNGRSYTWQQMYSQQNWVTTNSRGQVVFESPSKFGSVDCSFRPALPSAKVTRLTSEIVERPVYRIELPEQTRVFDGELPADIPVAPYSVAGLEKATGNGGGATWRPVGKVMPISAPKIDRSAKRVTFGAATFYYQDEPGKAELTKLRISGPYSGEKELELAKAAPPPDDLLLSQSLKVTPATKQPVTANGLSQEPLKLKIVHGSDDEPYRPDDPKKGWLYNYVYFVDGQDKLITNLLQEDKAEDGYTTVSPVKGGYVNTIPALQAANDPLVYLSTTKSGGSPVGVKARLDVGNGLKEVVVSNVPTTAPSTTEVKGNAAIPGIVPDRPAADPESGALYYRKNGKTDQAGILTRYEAVTSPMDLPMRTPYWGYFVPQSGGTTLRLHSEVGMQDTSHYDTGFVMNDGTYSELHNLPKYLPTSK